MREVRIRIPEHANIVLHTLHEAGYEAYIVGGCVRDAILGRCPHDWDITTSAHPDEVKALFRRTVDTGLKHGTVTVMVGKDGYEVTTYRVDGEYKDGRHPESVTFTASLLEDLKRRDFTINAMAYSDKDGLVDEFDGIGDLDRGMIRAVGDPVQRFTEDALRIMRAVRFAAQLGYEIDPATAEAARQLAPNLVHVSAERIRVELEKLLVSRHPERLRTAYELGMTAQFLPEFDVCMGCDQINPHHCYSVGEHILHAVCESPADRILRLTMLLHDIAKPLVVTTDAEGVNHFKGHVAMGADMANDILRRLKYDNDTRKRVVRLIAFHEKRPQPDAVHVRRLMAQMGPDLFPEWLEVKRADALAQSDYEREAKLWHIDQWRARYDEIMARGDCLSLRTLAVKGKDLIEVGIRGEAIGDILEAMLEDVVTEPMHNDKDYLMANYVHLS